LHNTQPAHTPNEGVEYYYYIPPCMLQKIEGPMREYYKIEGGKFSWILLCWGEWVV